MNDQKPKSAVSRRRFLQNVGVAGGVVVLGSSSSMRVFAAQRPPAFKLGQIAPMTGSAAEFGPFYREAAALAVEQLNKAAEEVFGGPIIAGHVAEDTNTLPTPAIESGRKLVDADGVSVIIGGWSSGVTTAVAESVSIPSGVLQISNGSTSPLISVLPSDRQADMLFRTTSSDALQGVVAAQLAAGEIMSNYKFESASTIFVNNPYGQGLSNAFSRSFQLRGGKIYAQVPHPEEVQPTYKSQLALALKDNPDLLVAVSYPGHTATYLKECRDFFEFTSWQFVDGNKSEKVLEAVGAKDLAGKLGTTPGQDPSIPAFQDFAKAYKARFNRDRIPPFTESAYDAAIAAGFAAAKAIVDGESNLTGTVLRDRLRNVSNPPGEVVNGGTQERITAGLRLIKQGKDVDYSGAAGACNFDQNGDVITPIALWEFTAGSEIKTVRIQAPNDIPAE
ncbi:MAG: ABC transporter substrate-binding protein [Gammaproteobacteria bacterium]|nr:ABC transporter substrate-binding protein [Gammaproteobacteria bacterium]NIR82797.1 ABC transporter substrate-binding protein [Gammaproteobacteria bacterium]NIR89906.1 ABC transporter substrate-binding protein [Gammaproteobacteria bacterium]NIU03955.1 ABC transporter substrate-binding protein [Gammaproteobacteria bacterium]NIV51275.1 ABC transporter substrate-binding protein [Gammaproteobacteria bacterium]